MGWDDDCKRWGDDPADLRALDAWLTRSDVDDYIARYTRADAIADGTLVDVTAYAREAGLTLPTAMTATFVAELGADDPVVLGRVLGALRAAAAFAGQGTDRVEISVRGRWGWVDAWALVGPGDDLRPVLTVMSEGED